MIRISPSSKRVLKRVFRLVSDTISLAQRFIEFVFAIWRSSEHLDFVDCIGSKSPFVGDLPPGSSSALFLQEG